MKNEVRVIFYQDDSLWMAQCLEHDICVQANSLGDLYGRFEVALRLEMDGENGLEHVPSAPAHFERMWSEKSGDFTPSHSSGPKFSVGLAA